MAGYVDADGENEEKKESSGMTEQSAAQHAVKDESEKGGNIFIVNGERS